MKINNKSFIPALIAAGLMWAPTAALAQEIEADVDVQANPDQEREIDVEAPDEQRNDPLQSPHKNPEGQVTAANKAGNIMGMEVKSDQGVKLGEIEEIVLDVPQGRIAYLVMSAGGFLGFGERWIALPPSTLKASPGNDFLILSTDDRNVLGAAGFPKTNWPRVDQPHAWGSDLRDDSKDQSERIEIRKEQEESSTKVRTDAQPRDAQLRSEVRIDNDTAGKSQTFSGRVASVDPESRAMSVVSDGSRLEFEVSDQARITLGRAGESKLTDVRIGQEVEVTYMRNQKGEMVVQKITRKSNP